MICKECNNKISEDEKSRYVIVKLYEKASIKINSNTDIYAIDRGNVYVCYDCWKEVAPSQYHIKELSPPIPIRNSSSTLYGTRTVTPADYDEEENDWFIGLRETIKEIKI